jgi:hypothetical protein
MTEARSNAFLRARGSSREVLSAFAAALAGLVWLTLASCSSGAVVSSGSAGHPGSSGAAGSTGAAGVAGTAGTGPAMGTAGTGPPTGAAGTGQAAGAAGKGPATGAAGAGQTTGAAGASPDGGASDAGTFYDVPPPPPASRGATVPWIEYEAEAASTNGVAVGPDRTFGTIASEASGRRAVRLEAAGQYVELTSTARANAIVVRYVIPDAPPGGGTTATLNLYVDGALRQPLALTSRYAWSYGGEASTSNDPSQGGAHHYFDEARALVGDIPPGAKVRLQKDATNAAMYYVIDLVDLEYVGPPLPQPANSLALDADCGAKPGDGQDDGKALQTCVKAGQNMGKSVWIPPGIWEMTAPLSDATGVTTASVEVHGAGMWYSTLQGPWARFHCAANGCRFFDFAILGDTTARDDTASDNGFNGGAGTGSRLERVWVEHTKVGYWVGAGNVADGLVITGCRFRDLMADGVNFASGTSNSEVVSSHFRNTGDDALASWSTGADPGMNSKNVFHFDTVQVPWRANCFGIYGGSDNRVEDNVCADVVTYPGVLVAQQFGSDAFGGTTTVQRNTITRAGGHMFNQEHGAVEVFGSLGPVSGVLLKDLQIDSPTYAGLHIEGPNPITNATFDTISITNAGSYGILVRAKSTGGGTFSNVTVTGSSGLNYEPNASFTITKGAGDSGW